MPTKPTRSPEMIAAIVARYDRGESLRALAKEVGLCSATIHLWTKREAKPVLTPQQKRIRQLENQMKLAKRRLNVLRPHVSDG